MTLAFPGPFASGRLLLTTNAAVTLTNGNTITTAGLGLSRVTNGGAVTGIIMQAGTVDGQVIVVENDAAASVTMAAAGTSNVANGTSAVIAALNCAVFVWNSTTALWYPVFH